MCTFVYMDVEAKVGVGCLPLSFSTLFLETESLTGPGAWQVG